MKGIDISMHNGNINFDAVKSDGVEVIIIKATEGVQYIDPKFESYYSQAKDKFNIGFYHFMSEKTDPARQAEDFWNAIKDKSYNVKPVLDIETNNRGRSREEISNRCIQFLDRFKQLSGIDCIIYTGGYFGRDLLDNRVKQYGGWIAHYGVDKPMDTGFTIVGHQFTENGRIAGISGDCDVNNFYEGILLNSTVSNNNNVSGPTKIEQLQPLLGVNVTGSWNDETEAAAKDVFLKMNNDNNSELVKWVQSRLGCKPDGIFGPITRDSVIGWQSKQGLKVDGIVGINTIKSLALY